MTCLEVSNTWNELLISDIFDRESELMLIKKKKNVEMLFQGSRNGNVEQVRNVLSLGLYTNYRNEVGRTPLECAAYYGQPDVVRVLLDAGADPNEVLCYNGESPLCLAAIYGHSDVVKLLLDIGVDPNEALGYKRKYTLYHAAISLDTLMWSSNCLMQEQIKIWDTMVEIIHLVWLPWMDAQMWSKCSLMQEQIQIRQMVIEKLHFVVL